MSALKEVSQTMATLSAASSLSSYLNNIKADPRLLGPTTLLNPMPDHVSAQRGKMFSDHASQWQVLKGCEFPYVFTGYEKQIGSYEVSTTERNQDIAIERIIPKFNVNNGSSPLTYYPSTTVIYKTVGNDEPKYGYFNIDKFTARSDGYGYSNVQVNYSNLSKYTLIPKNEKLVTSPCHKGNKYCYGTNLRVAYMSLPHVTEDAFLISETAARKCGTTGIDKVTINIKIDQIPVNLYGNEDGEYKFFPDVGEYVNDDGILCALRKPTAESFIYDTAVENLSTVQPLHDTVYYAPRGAKIVDVDVVINSAAYQSQPMFAQCEKYRDQLDAYWAQIYETYQEIKKRDGAKALTFDFNSLIAAAYNRLRVDNYPWLRDIPSSGRRRIKPRIKKEVVEYISLTITYMYDRELQCGYKLAGRYGNKGVVSIIMPDEMMPVDENGLRADIVVDPISVFNRMNPAQWYEQFFNRGSELLMQRVKDIIATTHNYGEAYNLITSYCTDINPNYGKKIKDMTDTELKRKEFINDCVNDGVYLNVVPFMKDIDQNKIIELVNKYHIYKSPVRFGVYTDETKQNIKWITTKKPVMIGYEYWMMLYKMPHAHGSGISHVNQYRTPVKGSKFAMEQYPVNQTPFRLGEDEVRNLIMVAGANTAAKILCEYANSPEAVNDLAGHLLNDEHPGALKSVDDLTLDQMVKGNGIVGVTKHIFSTFGVDISPEDEE